jgi:protein disulfide isomerase
MNKITLFTRIFLLALLAVSTFQVESGDSVVDLTDKTLNEFLQNNEHVLLEFYTEGCPHCEEFAPIYSDLGRQVASTGLNVKVARIDGNKNEESSTEWGIQGFPTVKYVNLKNNIKSDYNGDRSVEAIIKYLENKLNRNVAQITDLAQFNQLEKDKKVFIVFCGSNTTNAESFIHFDKVISQHEDLDFYWTENADVLHTLGCTPAKPDLVIIKNFDEGKLIYNTAGPLNATHFQDWISVYTTPVVLEMTNENVQMSMHNQIPTVFLVLGNGTDSKQLDEMFYNYAKQHRREIIFISSKIGNELADKILEFYQVKEDQTPAVLGLYPHGEQQISKYKFTEAAINEASFSQWLKDFVARNFFFN